MPQLDCAYKKVYLKLSKVRRALRAGAQLDFKLTKMSELAYMNTRIDAACARLLGAMHECTSDLAFATA